MPASATAATGTGFAALYQRIKPSVVYVVSALPNGAASGSGFIYKADASTTLVVTANHVIEGASRIDVILDSSLSERYPAEVVTRDHVRDVALLRIAVGNRKPLALEDPASVQEGMEIAVIGYPRVSRFFERIEGDDLRPSVHRGTLSAVRLGGEIVQFDATTDHGDSGGPVIDASSGRVVAIVRGAPLDTAYASRGIEQALPGSFYGPSSSTIRSALAEAAPAQSVSTVATVAQSSTVATAPTARTATAASANSNSAAYRVGFLSATYTDPATEAIGQALLQKLTTDLQTDNSFYLVPVTLSGTEVATSEQLLGFCQDSRLNAIMYPRFLWAMTGGPQYSMWGTYYTGYAKVEVDLSITDCAGEAFYAGSKSKTENRYFANRDPNREITDMANDLVDQLFKDFSAARAAHQAAWDTLMKFGLGIDPNDNRYHAMFAPYLLKSGQWQVYGVFPGGPAEVAGIKRLDIIVSIDGTSVDNLNADQLTALMNKPQYTMVVERPGGPVSLSVHPEQYQQLISTLTH